VTATTPAGFVRFVVVPRENFKIRTEICAYFSHLYARQSNSWEGNTWLISQSQKLGDRSPCSPCWGCASMSYARMQHAATNAYTFLCRLLPPRLAGDASGNISSLEKHTCAEATRRLPLAKHVVKRLPPSTEHLRNLKHPPRGTVTAQLLSAVVTHRSHWDNDFTRTDVNQVV